MGGFRGNVGGQDQIYLGSLFGITKKFTFEDYNCGNMADMSVD